MKLNFWPFGKKQKAVVTGKYQEGDLVYYVRRGERTVGYIYNIYADADGTVLYDVQVGGQCPYIWHGLKEDEIHIQPR